MEKLRAAVIGRTGHGDYGHGLDLVWNDLPGVELVAVADDNKVGLAKKAQQLKVDKAFVDYRQMLDEVKPDVVSIGCRWLDQHRDIVVETAGRGVHIYLEKPLCRTLAEADDMVQALEKTHAKLVCAHTTRHSPRLKVMQDLVADGKIGRILELRGRGKEDQRGGGEDLWVLGSHVMDLIRIFGGDPAWCFSMVHADGKPVTKANVVEGAEGIGPLAGDAIAAMYGMPNDATAYFATQRKAAPKRTRFGLTILGTEGRARNVHRLSACGQVSAGVELVGRPNGRQMAKYHQCRSRQARTAQPRARPQREPPLHPGTARLDSQKPQSQRRHLRRTSGDRNDRRGVRIAPAWRAGAASAGKSSESAAAVVTASGRSLPWLPIHRC